MVALVVLATERARVREGAGGDQSLERLSGAQFAHEALHQAAERDLLEEVGQRSEVAEVEAQAGVPVDGAE